MEQEKVGKSKYTPEKSMFLLMFDPTLKIIQMIERTIDNTCTVLNITCTSTTTNKNNYDICNIACVQASFQTCS